MIENTDIDFRIPLELYNEEINRIYLLNFRMERKQELIFDKELSNYQMLQSFYLNLNAERMAEYIQLTDCSLINKCCIN